MPKPKRRMPEADIRLRFKDGESLLFSHVREKYFQCDAWKGIKPEQMRERLVRMRSEFEKVGNALTRLDYGESAGKVASDLGVNVTTVKSWRRGKHLPRAISVKMLDANLNLRTKYLNGLAISNPRVVYILGMRMGSQMGTYPPRGAGSLL